jgi:anti-anti-sigma factor
VPLKRSVLVVLAQHGIDVHSATAAGRLLVLPAAAVYPAGLDGQVAQVKRALAEGYRGVRTSGEVSAALTVVPEQVYAGLERSMDALCRFYPMSTLCQYDRATTTGMRLEQATTTHGGGIRESQLHTVQHDGGLILAGEVDWSNELVLRSALRAATRRVSEMVRVDLRRVSFLSAGGCRALAVGTHRFRDGGGRVLLVAPQPIVERVLRLYGLDALTHVELIVSQP